VHLKWQLIRFGQVKNYNKLILFQLLSHSINFNPILLTPQKGSVLWTRSVLFLWETLMFSNVPASSGRPAVRAGFAEGSGGPAVRAGFAEGSGDLKAQGVAASRSLGITEPLNGQATTQGQSPCKTPSSRNFDPRKSRCQSPQSPQGCLRAAAASAVVSRQMVDLRCNARFGRTAGSTHNQRFGRPGFQSRCKPLAMRTSHFGATAYAA
jgi:hypothetical protein